MFFLYPLPYSTLRSDEGTTYKAITYIEHSRLPGSNCRHHLMEADEQFASLHLAHHLARYGTTAVTDAHRELLLGEEAPGIDQLHLLHQHILRYTYPYDVVFDIDLRQWNLVNSTDFEGKSHEKITMEVYSK